MSSAEQDTKPTIPATVTPETKVPTQFPSLASLRAAHTALLRRHREQGNKPAVLAEIEQLVQRGRLTGAALDDEDERWTAQGLLDYWSSVLYRAGQVNPPDSTLVEFDPSLAPALSDELCPYLGLAAFQAKDEHLFFGRQRLLGKLLKHLESHRLLVVVGSSGSGKSSVVLGGLLPKLQAGILPGSENWRYYAPLVPGSDPLAALARRLEPASMERDAWVSQQVKAFREDAFHLLKLVTAEVHGPTAHQPAVLFIDQFEEIFTLCQDETMRTALVQNLVNFVRAKGMQNRLILTMRTDFESQLVRLPGLLDLFKASHVRVTALEATELREAIAKPAALVGLKFEEGLIDALLSDVLGEPAALPLLQFTLLKLWDHRDRNRLTWEAYRRLGSGRLALARSADEFYDDLIPEEQITTKRILLRMVRPGEGLEVTSRRIPRAELYRTGEAQDRVDRVLDKLIQARLVRLTEGSARDNNETGDEQVEVAHEALIRNWPQLVNWLEDERVTLRQRLRLTAAAEQWKNKKRDSSTLLRGLLLEEAKRYEDLSDLEKGFIRASSRSEARNKRLRFSVGAIAFLLLATTSILAFREAKRASTDAQQARQSEDAMAKTLDFAVSSVNWIYTRNNPFNLVSALNILQENIDRPRVTHFARRTLAAAVQVTLEKNRLYGHEQSVRAVAYSPDNRYVVSGSVDKSLKLWDAETGALIRTIDNAADDWIYAIAFSPDGQRIASAGKDNQIRLWSVETGAQIGQAWTGHTDEIRSISFSPDGERLASGSKDATVRIWDVENGRAQRVINDHFGPVLSVQFSPDGTQIVSGSSDLRIRLWNAKTGARIRSMSGHQGSVFSVAFNYDGTQIASGSSDRTVRLWNVKTGQPIGFPLQGHDGKVYAVRFSPGDRYVISTGDDRSIRMWHVKGGKVISEIREAHDNFIWSIDISPDGRYIASGGSDKTIRLWDIRTALPTGRSIASSHKNSILSIAQNPINGRIVSADEGGKVILWDPYRERDEIALGQHSGAAYAVAFSPDGSWVVSGGVDGMLKVWNAQTGAAIRTLKKDAKNVYSVAVSANAELIASGGNDGILQIWNAKTGQPLGEPLSGHSARVYSVAFSPDGQYMASGGRDDKVIIWDVATRQPIHELEGHTNDVWSVAFSPDSQKLVSGGLDKTLRIWKVSSGQLIGKPLEGHENSVWSVAFSPNGQYIASGSSDRTVRLWDATTRQLIEPVLAGHTGSVWSVIFNTEGTRLLSAGADLTLKIWPTDWTEWPAMACNRLQYHPLFTEPKTLLSDDQSLDLVNETKAACETKPWLEPTQFSLSAPDN